MPREVFGSDGKSQTFDQVTETLKQDFYQRYPFIAASRDAEEAARQYVAENHPMLDAYSADDYRRAGRSTPTVKIMTQTAFTPTPDDLPYPDMLNQVGHQIGQAIERTGNTNNLISGLMMQAGRKVTGAKEQAATIESLQKMARKHGKSLEEVVLSEEGLKGLVFKELGLK